MGLEGEWGGEWGGWGMWGGDGWACGATRGAMGDEWGVGGQREGVGGAVGGGLWGGGPHLLPAALQLLHLAVLLPQQDAQRQEAARSWGGGGVC